MNPPVHVDAVVVGLSRSNAGRVCKTHPDGCGKYLQSGDYITFQKSYYVDSKGVSQQCCKCHRWVNGKKGCTIGMLSQTYLDDDMQIDFDSKLSNIKTPWSLPYLASKILIADSSCILTSSPVFKAC